MPYAEFPGTVVGRSPRSSSPGRPYGRLIWVIMHSTEGSESARAAEDGNAYDARRTDGTSCHVFIDRDTVVQEVNSENRAHAALAIGNNRGYQVELCGRAAQTAQQWRDAGSGSGLELAAKHVAYVCRKHGIPPRWVTRADVEARRPGLMTHKNVTDWLDGTHTDPGPHFPYAWFAGRVAWYLTGQNPPPVKPTPPPVTPSVRRKVNMLIKESGSPEVYCIVPGQGRYYVTAETFGSLVQAYGNPVNVAKVEHFGPEVPAPGQSSVPKRTGLRSAALYDGQVDNPDVDTERDHSKGPQ